MVEILKGAAAATLYGTEASAGVIQIFTKQGSRGAPRFDFMTEQGFSRYPASRYEPEYGWVRTDALAASQSDALGIQIPTAAELSAFYGRPVQPFEILSRNVPEELFETGVTKDRKSVV